MEIRTLRSFIAVADAGGFSEAATRINLTQSAISRHVKSLEDELGAQLFIRQTKRAILTESGTELLGRAKRLVRDADDCSEHIKALNGSLTGELRIGVGSFIEPYIRTATLKMMRRYPGVRLNVEFGKACRLNQMLREHKLDIAFTMNTAYREEGIMSERCIPFIIRAFMGKSHVLASCDKVTFAELMKHEVIMPDVGERVFQTFQKYIAADLSKLNVKAVVSSPDAAIGVLGAANLITFLPDNYLDHRDDLVAKPIEGLEKELYSNVHWMADAPLKKSAMEFINIIHKDNP